MVPWSPFYYQGMISVWKMTKYDLNRMNQLQDYIWTIDDVELGLKLGWGIEVPIKEFVAIIVV